MSFIISRPVSDEQKRERDLKRAQRENEQLQIEHDLIIADLLDKISRLEANQHDRN